MRPRVDLSLPDTAPTSVPDAALDCPEKFGYSQSLLFYQTPVSLLTGYLAPVES
jgi:hypothetical protein